VDKPLDNDVLLAWGRDWQRHLDGEAEPGRSYHIAAEVLKQYVTKANEGLALLKEREARKQGGRPRGSGIGAKVAALIACGVAEDDAVRMIAEAHHKPPEKVRETLRKHRAR
jgi:hypothetical protein